MIWLALQVYLSELSVPFGQKGGGLELSLLSSSPSPSLHQLLNDYIVARNNTGLMHSPVWFFRFLLWKSSAPLVSFVYG